MTDKFFPQELYPFQDQVLRIIHPLKTGFYLTGGTAVSRGYLQHRYSDDLDFFVNDEEQFGLWGERIIQALNARAEWKLDVGLRQPRFIRLSLLKDNINLKLEFVNDVPAHVGEIKEHPLLGRLDSPENILANKLTAIIDRDEPKDLADIWGLCTKLRLSLEDAIRGAQGKAAGIFAADLARVLLSASPADWAVIRWIQRPEVDIFTKELHLLGEKLLLIE